MLLFGFYFLLRYQLKAYLEKHTKGRSWLTSKAVEDELFGEDLNKFYRKLGRVKSTEDLMISLVILLGVLGLVMGLLQ